MTFPKLTQKHRTFTDVFGFCSKNSYNVIMFNKKDTMNKR